MATLEIVCADMLFMAVDAIVCPAHKHLIRGRGLSAQIFDSAGPELVEACSQLEKCAIGEARITPGFKLPAQFIIHTITPQWSSGDQWGALAIEQLQQCYRSVLTLAIERGINSLVFPALGAGTNRFPQDVAAHVGIAVLADYENKFQQLAVCLHSRSDLKVWQENYQRHR